MATNTTGTVTQDTTTETHPFGIHGDYCTGLADCTCDMCIPEADHDLPGEITWERLDQAVAAVRNLN